MGSVDIVVRKQYFDWIEGKNEKSKIHAVSYLNHLNGKLKFSRLVRQKALRFKLLKERWTREVKMMTISNIFEKENTLGRLWLVRILVCCWPKQSTADPPFEKN